MKIRKKILKKTKEVVEDLFPQRAEIEIEIPPKLELGDFAIPCFEIAKKNKENPQKVAEKIKENFPALSFLKEVKTTGGYLNFTIKKNIIFEETIKNILKEEDKYFFSDLEKENIMIEFISPNSNKPLHIGHLRNACLGDAVANILEKNSKKVTRTCLINDKGIPIFKSLLVWMKWHQDETPKKINKKPDHFLGDLYVEYEQKNKEGNLKEETQELIKKWEKGDKEIRKKWKTIINWFLEGFKESISKIDVDFDLIQYESNLYQKGKEIVKEGVEKKIFEKDKDGKVIKFLPEKEFGKDKDGNRKKALLLRKDGTSVYLTQDVGVAVKRFEEYNLDKLIYIVGSEQKDYFKRLFSILNSLGYKWSKNCSHLPYGLVDLPEGSMSSRKGNVVKLDDLINKIKKLAEKEIEKRHDFSKEKRSKKAEKITKGAIKFYLLRVNPSKKIQFDPDKATSFEGATGPYCQYAYARIQSILKKSDEKIELSKMDFSNLDKKEEIILLKKLIDLPQKIEGAVEELDPSLIANAVYNIAKDFSTFYNKHSILFANNKETKKARLALTKATAKALKEGLSLLGIEVLEEM